MTRSVSHQKAVAKMGIEKPKLPDSQICHVSSLEANTD